MERSVGAIAGLIPGGLEGEDGCKKTPEICPDLNKQRPQAAITDRVQGSFYQGWVAFQLRVDTKVFGE